MLDDDDEICVCHECVGDDVLKAEIQSEGEKTECTFCNRVRRCIPLEKIAERIHDVLEEQFYLTPGEPQGIDYLLAKEGLWERPGEPTASRFSRIWLADTARAGLTSSGWPI